MAPISKEEMTTRISRIIKDVYVCNEYGFTISSLIDHLKNDFSDPGKCNEYVKKYTGFPGRLDIYDYANRIKKCIVKFFDIDVQQNNNIDEDPIVSVYSAVEALVKAYDLKKLAAKVNALPAFDTQQNDSFEQFQPGIHAFMDAYDIDTAAAFNTKIYQLIASDIQDSKTNSALQQQLAALCNQVETLTGQVQQLSEQIQQLKNPPTKSE
ncbi:MAG: hypothetical protein MR378_02685 [Ruminococcus sp.]|nr:hypothetical protein [Ruminococcus sp.]